MGDFPIDNLRAPDEIRLFRPSRAPKKIFRLLLKFADNEPILCITDQTYSNPQLFTFWEIPILIFYREQKYVHCCFITKDESTNTGILLSIPILIWFVILITSPNHNYWAIEWYLLSFQIRYDHFTKSWILCSSIYLFHCNNRKCWRE